MSVLKKVLYSLTAFAVALVVFFGGFWTAKLTADKDLKELEFILSVYKKNYYDIDEEKDLVGLFADELLKDDKFSEYYTKEQFAEIKRSDAGNREGVGVALDKSGRVVTVIGNSPAYRAGVKENGVITGVKAVGASGFIKVNGDEEIGEKFADPRRTGIEPVVDDIDIEDLIEEEDNVITVTHLGYVKRLAVDTYKSQKRGGKGVIGLSTKEEDFISTMFVSSTHAHILFFTSKGKMYRIKAYEIPEAGRQAKGTPIVNIISIDPDERISAVIPVREYEDGKSLLMCTREGVIKKTDLMEYSNAPKAGKIAIRLDDNDELISVVMTSGNDDIFVGSHEGKIIRFSEDDVRNMGRVSRGVRAMKLSDTDYIVGLCIAKEGGKLLTISENGYGKKTELSEYKCQTRGGKGMMTYRISEETGAVSGMGIVTPDDDIILITSEGVVIRMDSEDISTYGRVTKGVRLVRLAEGVKVVSGASVQKDDDSKEESSEDASADESLNNDNSADGDTVTEITED